MAFFCFLCKKIYIYMNIMKLELSNINKIKTASINLKGLTVIAGTNDTGKSTLGKMLFTVVKSLREVHVNQKEKSANRVMEKLEQLYSSVTKKSLELSQSARERFRKEFMPPRLIREISSTFYGNLSGDEREQRLQIYIADKKAQILSFDFGPRLTESCNAKLDAIHDELSEKLEPNLLFAEELHVGIKSEFMNNVCSAGTNGSTISFYGEEGSVKVEINNDEIKDVKMSSDLYLLLTDVTFIETPLYMQLMTVLTESVTYKDSLSKGSILRALNPIVPMHIKDLANKLELSQYNFRKQEADAMGIGKIIDGNFEYDKKTKDFQIVSEHNGKTVKVNSINAAAGAKMFGLIQLLLDTGEINVNKMLIIDEPENHLHPKWQIECARLLVKMAKSGIPLMISSHSPYFIQGIRYFVNKEQAEELVNYYLAEVDKESGYSVVTEVTDDLNKVFMKLAEPMNEIMNLDCQDRK